MVSILNICAYGPAIWGGCDTRRSIRAGSWYPATAGPINCHAAPRASVVSSGGARRVWRTFCRHGTNFNKLYACRGTNCLGARNLSRCRILIACICAYPGATAITNLSWVQEHPDSYREQKVWHLSRACGKQLTHIVRVGFSFFNYSYSIY